MADQDKKMLARLDSLWARLVRRQYEMWSLIYLTEASRWQSIGTLSIHYCPIQGDSRLKEVVVVVVVVMVVMIVLCSCRDYKPELRVIE